MKKKKLYLIAAIGLFLGAVLLSFGWVIYMMKSETGMMTPLPTGESMPGIFAIQDGIVNMYLVKTGGGYIAVDAGNDAETIARALKDLGIDPASVKALFITHADSDHVAAAGLFAKAAVYISEAEEQMIDGSTSRALIFKNKLERKHSTIRDGETLSIGGVTVKGVLTPGHTPGSICFLINNVNLFTGDTLSLKGGKAGLFNDFFNMDSATEKKSIDRISNLAGVKRIFTAHYGYSDDFAFAFSGWTR